MILFIYMYLSLTSTFQSIILDLDFFVHWFLPSGYDNSFYYVSHYVVGYLIFLIQLEKLLH